jgi:energy-coupling factor transporter ATP-binding protein EcfA2
LVDEPPAPGEPPFKGLQYFDAADADLFFGRETLTARLVGHLRQSRFLAVIVGASGSGKSSVVRAGLVPARQRGEPLADGTLPPEGSQNWRLHLITPSARPLESLAASLTRDSESVTATATLMDDMLRDSRALHLHIRRRAGRPILLVVDQFEELFTLCRDEAERRAFSSKVAMIRLIA